jgi:gluconokinase
VRVSVSRIPCSCWIVELCLSISKCYDRTDVVIVITGVTGSGKTTIGKLLATELQWKFYEGDDFHPSVNIEKLKRGEPLDDQDRLPWLAGIRDAIRATIDQDENAVIACSALKESYRRMLRISPQVVLVHLEANPELIDKRLKQRIGHFMNPALVQSQFETLEEPQAALQIDAGLTPGEIVASIRARLSLFNRGSRS